MFLKQVPLLVAMLLVFHAYARSDEPVVITDNKIISELELKFDYYYKYMLFSSNPYGVCEEQILTENFKNNIINLWLQQGKDVPHKPVDIQQNPKKTIAECVSNQDKKFVLLKGFQYPNGSIIAVLKDKSSTSGFTAFVKFIDENKSLRIDLWHVMIVNDEVGSLKQYEEQYKKYFLVENEANLICFNGMKRKKNIDTLTEKTRYPAAMEYFLPGNSAIIKMNGERINKFIIGDVSDHLNPTYLYNTIQKKHVLARGADVVPYGLKDGLNTIEITLMEFKNDVKDFKLIETDEPTAFTIFYTPVSDDGVTDKPKVKVFSFAFDTKKIMKLPVTMKLEFYFNCDKE